MNEIIGSFERGEDFGYVNLMNVQTHACLIDCLMRKYVLDYNKRWCGGNVSEELEKTLGTTTGEMLARGEYSVIDRQRLGKILLNK